jgi:hypothetical protein
MSNKQDNKMEKIVKASDIKKGDYLVGKSGDCMPVISVEFVKVKEKDKVKVLLDTSMFRNSYGANKKSVFFYPNSTVKVI